jgi:hypothetical protein
LEKFEYDGKNLFFREAVGGKVKVAMGSRMTQAMVLFIKRFLGPAGTRSPSLLGCFECDVKVEEKIGWIEALPHVGHTGMILGCRPGIITQLPQAGGQRALARSTRSYNFDITHGNRVTFSTATVPPE